MYRNYYSYNDMPSLAKRTEPQAEIRKAPPAPIIPEPEKKPSMGFLNNLSLDDIILLAILFLLLANGCEDKLLLAAIGFVFLTGIVF